MGTRKHRLQRLNDLDIAIKLALVNKKKRHFKQWMNAFVDAANTKIALFFWCHSVQSNVFDHWRQCLLWYTAVNRKADKLYKLNMFKRFFAMFVDAVIQKRNAMQWQKWKEATKKQTDDDKQIKEEEKVKEENVSTYLVKIPTVHVDVSQNLFFPLCGQSNVNAAPKMNLDQIELRQTKVKMNYIKHCEVQKILIPEYDKAMAAKYKSAKR